MKFNLINVRKHFLCPILQILTKTKTKNLDKDKKVRRVLSRLWPG